MNKRPKSAKSKDRLTPFLEKYRNRLAARYAQGKVLDLGCGPAPVMQHLSPDQEYVGVDKNRQLIDELQSSANRANARFYCDTIGDFIRNTDEIFDTILMIALIDPNKGSSEGLLSLSYSSAISE